jgi:hypothetical protein
MATNSWQTAAPAAGFTIEKSQRVQNIQARVVQHHYVRAQLGMINSDANSQKLIDETIQALWDSYPPAKIQKWNHAQLLQAFAKMTDRLQQAKLTINFKASSWFSQPNNYPSYTQMYERGIGMAQTGNGFGMRVDLKDTTLNKAGDRVAADDIASFSKEHSKSGWGGVQQFMNPLHKGFKKVTIGSKTVYEHETQGMEGIDKGSRIANPHFNPKTKQVFAALNYGYCKHGPAAEYGVSYMVLSDKFKTNAIYFAGDTFLNLEQKGKSKVTANDQISFNMLGAIYAKAKPHMRMQMNQVLLNNMGLEDHLGSNANGLLEAHLFEPMTFSGNIKTVYLSRMQDGTSRELLTPDQFAVLERNAQIFCLKHGATLITMV